MGSPERQLSPGPGFWRRLARVLHRDLGYFFFGATLVYAASGLAINHRGNWNPSYSVVREEFPAQPAYQGGALSEQQARALLEQSGRGAASYLQHFAPNGTSWRIFFQGGTATLDRDTLRLSVERLQKRPVLHLFNKLHYNPGRWWTWFSDAFAVALILVAVTGLFLLRGRHGITRRGGLLVLAGLLVPGVLVFINL
jgi:hypothetical protein